MTPTAFGPLANAILDRFPPDCATSIADPNGFADALVNIIDRRMLGEPRNFYVVAEEPRLTLLKSIGVAIKASSQSPDAFFRNLDGLSAGTLTINGVQQTVVENQMVPQGASFAFQDACLSADRTFFNSYTMLERCVRLFGYRPTRASIASVADSRVPIPNGSAPAGEELVVWAQSVHPAVMALLEAVLSELRTPHVIISDSLSGAIAAADSTQVLASARAILSVVDDPSVVYALARFNRPLCAPACGASAGVEGLQEFALWNRLQMTDAILRSFGAPPARISNKLQSITSYPEPLSQLSNQEPLVSLVMPTYSRPALLRKSLERLTAQTYANIEIIVVNNAGLAVDEVVADFPGVRLINRTHNTGNATRPRNDGIGAANGEYIAILDDDDVFFPDHVARMVAILKRGGDAVYSDFLVRFVERTESGEERVFGWDLQKPLGITTSELLVINRLGYLTIFAKTSVFQTLGLFAEEVLGGEEVEYWLRICSKFDFVHADQPTTAYTVAPNWEGQLSEKSHALYAGGYEMVYERYAATGLPLVRQARDAYLSTLRSTTRPAPMHPRYRLEK
ncbi:MAG: glycosyltransferase [Candidatus Eremiobacteraeota bacterium]|nr:glycosyltransferase [Candidatus Eremiobacteraeota bacterium]